MALIRWLQNKYAISCPHCGNELNWFDSSVTKDYLKCVPCDMFIINDVALIPTVSPRNRIEHLKKMYEGYHGVPTSYFYKLKWLRKIENLLKIH